LKIKCEKIVIQFQNAFISPLKFSILFILKEIEPYRLYKLPCFLRRSHLRLDKNILIIYKKIGRRERFEILLFFQLKILLSKRKMVIN